MQMERFPLSINRTKERMIKSVRNADAFRRFVLQHSADQVKQMTLFDTASDDIRLQHNKFRASYMFMYFQISL